MSRDITRAAANALINGRSFKQSNTRVEDGKMYLHGNEIARVLYDGSLFINLCGWVTLTTCERLNGLPEVNLKRCKGKAFLNGKEIAADQWYYIRRV